jgi:hypothetical protein
VSLLSPLQCRILASSRASILESSSGREEAKERDCSTATDLRLFLRFSRSHRVKEREAPENLVTRLVTGNSFLGHTSCQGQMRCHFRSWRGFPTGCNVMLDESDENHSDEHEIGPSKPSPNRTRAEGAVPNTANRLSQSTSRAFRRQPESAGALDHALRC